MGQLVIVTKQCYLICEGINYISVDEAEADDFLGSKSSRIAKAKTRKQKKDLEDKTRYKITIDFIPAQNNAANNNNRRHGDIGQVSVDIVGKSLALELFQEMVKQIRDQMPDVLHLNNMVENFLTSGDK